MYAEKNLFAEEVSPVPVLLSNACNDEFHSMIFYPGRATPIYLVSIAMLAGCGSDSGSGAPDTTVCSTASANTLEEGFSGDFSDDPAMPTRWTLGAGTNELIAGTATGDLDYASFTVGNCDALTSITVNAFSASGGDDVAFIAIQRGSTFTVTPGTADGRIDELDGFQHFGTAQLNQDILLTMGQAGGAIGFTSPLPTGTYTLWLNQVGPRSEYTLGFNVSRVSDPE
jgi:hypothetical protein